MKCFIIRIMSRNSSSRLRQQTPELPSKPQSDSVLRSNRNFVVRKNEKSANSAYRPKHSESKAGPNVVRFQADFYEFIVIPVSNGIKLDYSGFVRTAEHKYSCAQCLAMEHIAYSQPYACVSDEALGFCTCSVG